MRKIILDESLVRRFWKYIDKCGANECWEWKRFRMTGGYGYIGRSAPFKGGVRAHRVSWSIHNGPIPDGFLVLHKCDNPPCANPAHLYLGTHKDNNADTLKRGRHVVHLGERHHNSKLTNEAVREIRESLLSGERQCVIAKKHNVSQNAIYQINVGKTWSHLK